MDLQMKNWRKFNMIMYGVDSDFIDFMFEAMGFHRVEQKDVKKEEKKMNKMVGDYTLKEIKVYCPYANGNKNYDNDGAEACDECKFNCACAMTPDEWEDDKLNSDGKKHLTKEEKDNILKQIEELKKQLEE